jgi:transposase InsO family protein
MAAIMFGVRISSVAPAARRLGGSIMSVRQNRRIFKNKGCYCFRYRTATLNVYRRLSPDIHRARIMRDKIEQQLGLSK